MDFGARDCIIRAGTGFSAMHADTCNCKNPRTEHDSLNNVTSPQRPQRPLYLNWAGFRLLRRSRFSSHYIILVIAFHCLHSTPTSFSTVLQLALSPTSTLQISELPIMKTSVTVVALLSAVTALPTVSLPCYVPLINILMSKQAVVGAAAEGQGAIIFTEPERKGDSAMIPGNAWCTDLSNIFGNFNGRVRSMVVEKGFPNFMCKYITGGAGRDIDSWAVTRDALPMVTSTSSAART